MSKENKDKADAAEARSQQTKGFMQQKNGTMSVDIEPKRMAKASHMFERRGAKLSILEGRVLDLIIEAFAEIENGGIIAKVRVDQNGIVVEWGDHIKSTEITLGNTRVGFSEMRGDYDLNSWSEMLRWNYLSRRPTSVGEIRNILYS